ncbi:hypothetical protein SESBI_10292 [Sesbania bispinosa]|nr:hypothetical protein SESBI_10292 [Sesbania bispinosa]
MTGVGKMTTLPEVGFPLHSKNLAQLTWRDAKDPPRPHTFNSGGLIWDCHQMRGTIDPKKLAVVRDALQDLERKLDLRSTGPCQCVVTVAWTQWLALP